MSPIARLSQKVVNNINMESLEKKARLIIPAGIAGVWGLQTAIEVKHAVEEDKKNAFIKNLIIGSAMIAGGLLGQKVFQKYLNKKVESESVKNFAEKHLLRNIPKKLGRFVRKFPTKDFLHALSIPVSAGILGGIAGEFAQKKFPVKYDEVNEVSEKANRFIDYKYGIMNQIDDIPGAGYIDTIHPSFSTIVGYSVGKQEGVKNKVKEFVFEIISGVIVPTAVALPVASKLNEKFPDKKSKNFIAALTFGVGIASTFAGKVVASWFNRQVTDKIIENKFWQDITAKQKELMKSYVLTDNPLKKDQIQKKVKELKELGDKVKNSEINVRGIASKISSTAKEKINPFNKSNTETSQ